MLEERIIRYCAPTLAGIKTGGLFNTYGISPERVWQEARTLKPLLSSRGLVLHIIDQVDTHALVYLYRVSDLTKDLQNPEVIAFLRDYGYCYRNAGEAVLQLANRIRESTCFPHEVGVFLSYPLEDVKAFIELGGASRKVCGHWCVYHNEEQARQWFQCLDHCTKCFRNRYQKGDRIGELAVAR